MAETSFQELGLKHLNSWLGEQSVSLSFFLDSFPILESLLINSLRKGITCFSLSLPQTFWGKLPLKDTSVTPDTHSLGACRQGHSIWSKGSTNSTSSRGAPGMQDFLPTLSASALRIHHSRGATEAEPPLLKHTDRVQHFHTVGVNTNFFPLLLATNKHPP